MCRIARSARLRRGSLWLANLTGETQTVKVGGFAGGATLHLIDEGSFAKLRKDPAYMKKAGTLLKKVGTIVLAPYAVARFVAA